MPLLFFHTAWSNAQPIETIPSVDLQKYSGKWFGIAFYPKQFQKGCQCSSAEYAYSDIGYFNVWNRCRRYSTTGKQSNIRGKAFVKKTQAMQN